MNVLFEIRLPLSSSSSFNNQRDRRRWIWGVTDRKDVTSKSGSHCTRARIVVHALIKQYASLMSKQITSVYVTKSKPSSISCWCSSPAEFLFITATPKLMFWAYHWYRCHRSHSVLLSGTRPIDQPSTWPGSFTVSQLHYISVNFSDHFPSHPNYSFISPLPQIEPEAERSQSPILTGSIGVKAIHFSASFFLFNEVPENPTPLAPLYMTSKHTILGIMRSLHLLLEFQGILMVSASVLSSSPVRLLSNTRTPNHL